MPEGWLWGQYYRCRIVVSATFDDFSRVDSSSVNSAAKKLFQLHNMVSIVKK